MNGFGKRLGVVVTLLAGLSLVGVGMLGGAGGEVLQGEDATHIEVVQTTTYSGSPCLPGALALSHETGITSEAFTVTIRANAPLCSPITVSAAIYAMPSSGGAWPQQLAEKVDFTLSQPGKTVVRFIRACTPAQYDIINGITPSTISPTGATHGPLLFPGDIGTSMQDFGNACGPATSTTTSSTTTTNPDVSTTDPDVLGTSTIPSTDTTDPDDELGSGATTSTSPEDPTQVLPFTQTPGGSQTPSSSDAGALAVTGSNSSTSLWIAAGLLLIGASMVSTVRTRVFR